MIYKNWKLNALILLILTVRHHHQWLTQLTVVDAAIYTVLHHLRLSDILSCDHVLVLICAHMLRLTGHHYPHYLGRWWIQLITAQRSTCEYQLLLFDDSCS